MFDFLDVYPWALPMAIFLGRLLDVPLGTLRIVFVSRGEKKLAPLIGFIEVFIWIVIISQVISRANGLVSYVAFAAGYAAGTYLGLYIESYLAFGFIKYRVFTRKDGRELMQLLSHDGFGATLVHGEGAVDKVDIIEIVIKRKAAAKAAKVVAQFDPKAFTLVEDIRAKELGIFTGSPLPQPMRQGK